MDMTHNMKSYTIKDIYALPEGKRAELIDGQMYMMASPGRIHQQISMFFSNKIASYIEAHHGECEVYAAPFAVFLNQDDDTYVEPDISVICDKSRLDKKGCSGAPDWIVEIISPGSRYMDYMLKLLKYKTAGVREYWIADEERNCISVYNFEKEEINYYTFQESVKPGIYNDFVIDFSQLILS